VTAFETLPDGRVLAYEEYGVPTGFPVLSFHGGLSSRLDAAPAHEAAVAKGVRLLSPDRPGIGLSTFQPGRRLVDWPSDVAHLTDALGIARFAVMGWSAGGPYAAVCAARMGDRVTAAALLSSAVPLDLYGTTRGLTLEDRALLSLTRRAPALASVLMKVSIVNASNARLLRAVMRSFPPADRTVLTEWGPPDHALAFVREAVRQGTEGCLQDYRIFGDPWGFGLEEIRVPVHLWEGGDDRTGPPGYRAFLKRHISQASVTVVPGEGHLSLLPHQAPAIFDSLLGGDHGAESTARRGVG
jgi:pimeloyl-ACP methyl ester carboxylesterase